VNPPESWLDVFRLTCARILVQIADACPEVESTARTGAFLFGEVDLEGGEVPLGGLIDVADDYEDAGEPTADRLRGTVESVLHDAVCDYFYEHVDDMADWSRWWAAVDIDDIVGFAHLIRPS
jgi:hypothetical protein